MTFRMQLIKLYCMIMLIRGVPRIGCFVDRFSHGVVNSRTLGCLSSLNTVQRSLAFRTRDCVFDRPTFRRYGDSPWPWGQPTTYTRQNWHYLPARIRKLYIAVNTFQLKSVEWLRCWQANRKLYFTRTSEWYHKSYAPTITSPMTSTIMAHTTPKLQKKLTSWNPPSK